jgi:hypothetical protein
MEAAKYTSGRERPPCGGSPGEAGRVDPLFDRGPHVGTEDVVVAGARDQHEPLGAPKSREHALGMGRRRLPVVLAVNEENGPGDAGGARHRAHLVHPEARRALGQSECRLDVLAAGDTRRALRRDRAQVRERRDGDDGADAGVDGRRLQGDGPSQPTTP